MLLIRHGNLNNLNDEGLTPLAYGSDKVLTLLDLKSGIATYLPNNDRLNLLPKDLDNNYLLNRGNWKKYEEDYSAVIKYKAIESNQDPVRHQDGYLSSYIQPGSASLQSTYKKTETNESEVTDN